MTQKNSLSYNLMQGQIIEGKEGKPSFKVGNDNHSTEIDLNQLLKQYIGCNLLNTNTTFILKSILKLV